MLKVALGVAVGFVVAWWLVTEPAPTCDFIFGHSKMPSIDFTGLLEEFEERPSSGVCIQ